MLYYIKKQLGVGSVYVEGNNAAFRIRDRNILSRVGLFFPIFDKYSLLTTKNFDYQRLKQAYLILEDQTLTHSDKIDQVEALRLSKPAKDYVSSAWSSLTLPLQNVDDAKKVMSKAWIVGFVEAEGSF